MCVCVCVCVCVHLQTLSTFRLTPEQCSDTSIDLLTGWHLVDGRERVIAVEGRSQGAMQVIQVC